MDADEVEDLPGWGQWPAQKNNVVIDVELEPREFLVLPDLIQPLESKLK